jgi:ribonuclease-3
VDEPLAALAERLGHRFTDEALLRRAVSHRSYCAEHPGEPSNERLEFLGDAVLGWIVADVVYRRYDQLSEGQLTDVRKAVVNAGVLAEVAAELDIGAVLLLGRGEDQAGGRAKTSILADAFEAVLGALYLDAGDAEAGAFVQRVLDGRIERAVGMLGRLDHKTLLQERTAERFERGPRYELTETGPDHDKTFTAVVFVGDRRLGDGEGKSKKQAEQAAATAALIELDAAPGA